MSNRNPLNKDESRACQEPTPAYLKPSFRAYTAVRPKANVDKETEKGAEDNNDTKTKTSKGGAENDKPKIELWPRRCLIFDTETRTDGLKLMFGFYRVCRLDAVSGHYLCEEEGIFYSGAVEDVGRDKAVGRYSAVLTKKELNTIGNYVMSNSPDVEVFRFPPRTKLKVFQNFPEFVYKVVYREMRRGSLITGFNLPFDLSRISIGWRTLKKKRGFALVFGKRFWRKTKEWCNDPYRPVVYIIPKDARISFISRGSTLNVHEWKNPGRSLDIGSLLFSLSNEMKSLKNWCKGFKDKILEKDDKTGNDKYVRQDIDDNDWCRTSAVKVNMKTIDGKEYEPSGEVTLGAC